MIILEVIRIEVYLHVALINIFLTWEGMVDTIIRLILVKEARRVFSYKYRLHKLHGVLSYTHYLYTHESLMKF